MNVKKKILLLLIISLLLIPTMTSAMEAPRIWVKGRFIDVETGVPTLDQCRTMVPVRFIAENLSYDVNWNPFTRKVSITNHEETEIDIYVGSDTMIKRQDGTKYLIHLDCPAKVIGGRTYVPLRSIAESFGQRVDWDEANNVAVIGEGYNAGDPCPCGMANSLLNTAWVLEDDFGQCEYTNFAFVCAPADVQLKERALFHCTDRKWNVDDMEWGHFHSNVADEEGLYTVYYFNRKTGAGFTEQLEKEYRYCPDGLCEPVSSKSYIITYQLDRMVFYNQILKEVPFEF